MALDYKGYGCLKDLVSEVVSLSYAIENVVVSRVIGGDITMDISIVDDSLVFKFYVL